MTNDTANLPINDTLLPKSANEVATAIEAANAAGSAIYPVGGGTSLNIGLIAKQPGTALQLTDLNQVVDYPARDMTITVGTGITIDTLRQTLLPESQRLPIDVPHTDVATLGGLIASNHSGSLRFGCGTMRDYVIGIRAVNGLGEQFAAGGRVVKNVAGYDFCKLLTGSMGTLGVITEVTLKLKPIPIARTFVCCQPNVDQTNPEQAERLLAALVDSKTRPVIVDLLQGWSDLPGLSGSKAASDAADWLVVGFEGTAAEVDWMVDQLRREWNELAITEITTLNGQAYDELYQRMIDFPADDNATLIVKASGTPSGTLPMVDLLRQIDGVSTQVHAGNGVVIAKFSEWPDAGLSSTMNSIRTAAAKSHGNATILSNPSGDEMTHQCVWGAANIPYDLMRKVKTAFDPNNILNPGRFVY